MAEQVVKDTRGPFRKVENSILRIAAILAALILIVGVVVAWKSWVNDLIWPPPECNAIGDEVRVSGGIDGGGWGPDRELFDYETTDSFANYPVLNSIYNAPFYGNATEFLDAKPADGTRSGEWCDPIRVADGEEVLLRVYLENSADDALAGRNLNGRGVARDVRVRFVLPSGPATTSQIVSAVVESSNTTPSAIWDGVTIESDRPFRITPIANSYASLHNDPQVLLQSSPFQTEGALVGSEVLDGRVVPGYGHAFFVVARVRVSAAAS